MVKSVFMFCLIVFTFTNAFAVSLENAIKDRKIRISPVEINGSPIPSWSLNNDSIAAVCIMIGARILLSYKVKDYQLTPEMIANDRYVRLYSARQGNFVEVDFSEWKYSDYAKSTMPIQVLDEVVCIK